MIERLPDEVLSATTDAERVEYSIHYQAVLETAKAYKRDPSKSRLRDWDEAKRALAAAESVLMDKYGEEKETPQEFTSQKEVLQYLKDSGYKIEKSALSKHVRAGRLKMRDGVYRLKDVDAFAELHLQSAGTGQTEADKKTAALHERKVRAEILRIEEQAAMDRIKRGAMEGKLIPRDDVELELAGRAVALEAGFDHMVYTRAAEWIELVGGDQTRAEQLIAALMEAKGGWLNQYASPMEFVVEIKGGNEA